MEWDEIEPVSYRKGQITEDEIEKLRTASAERLSSNERFDLIEQNARRLEEQQNESRYSLELDTYRSERKARRERAKAFENTESKIEGLKIASTKVDRPRIETDSIKMQTTADWHENLEKDVYLYEAMMVLKDMK